MSSTGYLRGAIGFLIFANCCNFAALYTPYVAIFLQIVCYIVAAILSCVASKVNSDEEFYAANRSNALDRKLQKTKESQEKKLDELTNEIQELKRQIQKIKEMDEK